MAAPVQPGHDTPERRAVALKLLEPDFHGLLQVKEVSETSQAKLAVARVRSVSRMSTVADDRASVRTFCANVLQLDATNDIVEIAALVDAWESCSTRMTVRHKAEAESSLSNVPRAVNKVEIQDLITRFHALHGYRLEDRTTPASSTLETVFDQIENGEMKAMSLSQFVCREDAEAEVFGAVIEKGTGTIKVRKGYNECPPPKGPEEFRRRVMVLAHTFLLAQLKYPQKAALKELQPQHFLRYLDLMLGEHVFGLKAKNQCGDTIATPEFSLLLSYDFQVRRQAIRLVNEGAVLHDALKTAMLDTTTKERYFLTPNVYSQVALCARMDPPRSRSPKGTSPSWKHSWKGFSKGRGKGKKGGKSKTKDKSSLHDNTPDGRQICWKWNSPHDRCRFACGRLHVCMYCFGAHPYHACPGKKDTAVGAEPTKEQK